MYFNTTRLLNMKHDVKQTNPKDGIGICKTPISVLPAQVLLECGLALYEGDRKYGRSNYRVSGVRASVYYDACMRHLMGWWEGTDIDPDSGISHVTKAIAGLMVLRDSMLNENWTDDRPPRVKNKTFLKEFNEKAKELVEKYPDPVPAWTELNKDEKR
jgi:hypothetical protein